ncbi:MAG TPA: hypothetical protein VFO94_02900 [Gammaproteobacteria bacterium]|nr:hypothetical protein [Gammaproteobacteria bacterium]
MSPSDVETFLTIKRYIARVRWLQPIVSGVAVIALLALWITNRADRELLNMLLGFSMCAGIFFIGNSRADAARDRLVELVEKQINRDPEALRYLAQDHVAR